MKRVSLINIILTTCFMCVLSYFVSVQNVLANTRVSSNVRSIDYPLAWPGILPDNKLYKLKVLRNKIIERIIINPVKKVEFDLLMADKTIYASQLLMKKGEIELSKETALKGENYYSILVQNYNKVLLEEKRIPSALDRKITLAAQKHQEVFEKLEILAKGEDKKTFQVVSKFSKINYEFIVGLRNPKKDL